MRKKDNSVNFGGHMKNQQIRQGDVLLVPVEQIPKIATQDAKTNERIVLAHGEVTGHAHVIDEPTTRYRMDAEGRRFIEIVKKALLKHEEHGAIHLVEGKMQQGFQTEDFGNEVKRVVD